MIFITVILILVLSIFVSLIIGLEWNLFKILLAPIKFVFKGIGKLFH